MHFKNAWNLFVLSKKEQYFKGVDLTGEKGGVQ